MLEFPNILVFSDDRVSTGTFQAFANECQFTLQIKEKKQSSLRAFLDNNYKLVFYDVSNAVLSEIEFFDKVHQMANGIPIIVLSQHFLDTKEIVFGKKIADFIYKPFELDKLMQSSRIILKVGKPKTAHD